MAPQIKNAFLMTVSLSTEMKKKKQAFIILLITTISHSYEIVSCSEKTQMSCAMFICVPALLSWSLPVTSPVPWCILLTAAL